MKKLLLALVGFFFVLSVQAETIPATPSPKLCSAGQSYKFVTSGGEFCSSTAICMGMFGVGVHSGASNSVTCNTTPTTTVVPFTTANDAPSYTCPTGQNWTLSGTVCTRSDCIAPQTRNPNTGICESPCGAGQTRVNGVCTCDTGAQVGDNGTCCPVAGSGGGAPMQWCYVDLPSATSCDSAGTNGCKVRCNNVTFQKGIGNTVTIWPKQALGQNCSYTGTRATNQGGGPLNNDELKQVADATADPGKAKTPEGCMAAGMGYVTGSGGTTCVGGGDTGVKKTETASEKKSDGTETDTQKSSEKTPTGGKETETTTTKNPDGTTTTTTTTTTCKDDGTCDTVKNTVTKDSNGNTTSDKTDNANDPLSGFCQKNPDSAMCKGVSDTCKDHPERVGCRDLGNSPEGGVLETKEVSPMALNPVSLASNDQCPAGTELPHGLGVYNWSPICDYASAMKPLILAFAWISAAFIVFAWKKD